MFNFEDERFTDLDKQARKIMDELIESVEADRIKDTYCHDDSVVEAIVFSLFNESVSSGDIIPTAFNKAVEVKDCDCGDESNHISPVVMMGADVYRSLMFAAFAVGLRFQRNTQDLESLWSVESNESPYDTKGV